MNHQKEIEKYYLNNGVSVPEFVRYTDDDGINFNYDTSKSPWRVVAQWKTTDE